MPEWLEDCVKELLGQSDFYPKRKDRESLAYAICQKQHKKALGEGQGVGSPRQGTGGTDTCICPKCGHESSHKRGTPCADMNCPECGSPMQGKEQKSIPMRITKATIRDGSMYWQGVVSDDDWDKEDERLDTSIFHDFRNRLDAERHKADYEPPFVSLSHYGRFRDRSGERGIIQDVWPHGKDFYAEGAFHDDPLSKRCFEVARSELERAEKGEKIDNPVRFSIAFIPEETTQEDGRTVYLKGVLDHVALTRVPVNPRTGFTQVTEKSMTTKLGDALSIVGEDAPDEIKEAVEELERKQHTEKSQAEDLIIKSDEELLDEDSPYTQEQDFILRAMLEQAGVDKAELEEKAWDYAYKKSLPDSAYAWVDHGEGCSKEDGKTPQSCRHLPYKDKSGSVDCAHVRAALQALGGARSGKPMSVPGGVKQKLLRALKGCQKKAEVLETELPDYEAGRIDGFEAAVDMLTSDEASTMTDEIKEPEAKADIDLDAVLEAVPNKASTKPEEPDPEEQKAEVQPPDELDTHLGLLRQVLAAEGQGREKKLEAADAVLRSLAIHAQKVIDETTPPSPEDIATSFKSQVEDVVKPLMDKIAVLEEAVLGTHKDAPKSKALSMGQNFYISPEASLRAVREKGTPAEEMSPITKLVRDSCGLPL